MTGASWFSSSQEKLLSVGLDLFYIVYENEKLDSDNVYLDYPKAKLFVSNSFAY